MPVQLALSSLIRTSSSSQRLPCIPKGHPVCSWDSVPATRSPKSTTPEPRYKAILYKPLFSYRELGSHVIERWF